MSLKLSNKGTRQRIQQLFNKVDIDKRLTLLEQKELATLIKGNYASITLNVNKHFTVIDTQFSSVSSLTRDLLYTNPVVDLHLTLHMVDDTILDIKCSQPVITQKILIQ